MITPSHQLDRRFAELRPALEQATRPSRGWIRAIRDALGMTSAQLAKRIGVTQPRIIEMEKAEIHGNISLQSLERAAEAMGCRLVYALVPVQPLTETLQDRAEQIAARQLASVDQTMRLEAQGVNDTARSKDALALLATELLRRPARLWDAP
ncbi:MAG: mobile mystery protein A [Caulobacter sp.]|nr:mobile mystery protein A [Caulobacter sp.]